MSDQQETNPVETKIIHTSDGGFENEVLKSDTPVLVDFWAEWCGPCKMIAPVLDEIANDFSGRVIVAKMNIDENPKTPQQYAVRGIPALILFKNGKVESQKVGVVSKTQLAAFLESAL